MIFPRATVAESLPFEGVGLHSGEPVKGHIHPSERGLYFRVGAVRVEAVPENVTDTSRCTRLGSVSTIEHLMSALAALGVTDAEIELSSPEMPGMDGSASRYFALLQGKTVPLGEVEMEGLFARVYEPGISIARGEGHWRYEFVVEDAFPGQQVYECFFTPEIYRDEIAPARTIAFEHEVEPARAMGLGRGLDETSCLVLGPTGYVNTPRYPDEPARHKLLDLMGDLWLARVPLHLLNVVGERTGHKANVAAAVKLAQAVRPK